MRSRKLRLKNEQKTQNNEITHNTFISQKALTRNNVNCVFSTNCPQCLVTRIPSIRVLAEFCVSRDGALLLLLRNSVKSESGSVTLSGSVTAAELTRPPEVSAALDCLPLFRLRNLDLDKALELQPTASFLHQRLSVRARVGMDSLEKCEKRNIFRAYVGNVAVALSSGYCGLWCCCSEGIVVACTKTLA